MQRICIRSFFICLFLSPFALGETPQQDPIEPVINGIISNSELLNNISFEYSVEYRYSDPWRKKKEESRNSIFLTQNPVPVTISRSGIFVRETDAFKITSKVLADQLTLIDESVYSDGVKVTRIDPQSKTARTTPAKEFTRGDLSFFPDKYQNLFLDGRSIQDIYNSGKAVFSYLGQRVYDGVQCEVLEITHSLKTPKNAFTKDRVWIAPEKGSLIKHGISFKTDPNQPINSITTKFKEISDGIWNYSEVLFESFPLKNKEPDVIQHLKMNNIKVNQDISNEVFVPDLTGVSVVQPEP